MFALFDDAGKFLAGRVMTEADASMQIELDSGKRVKVKAANVLIKFAKPAPADLLAQAAAQVNDIDVDLIWEVAPEDEFGFDDLAREYFSASADAVQQAAMLMRLFETPHYFHRRGKGRFKKAPEDILKQALVAIERKKQQALQIEQWAQELGAGTCPPAIKEELYKILFKPDKNGPAYKAVVEAAKATQRAPLDLLKDAGAIDSPYQFHYKRFLFEHFPKGTGFPTLEAPPVKDELPLASVQAFSIDDSMTTEIDDALSVQGLGTGTVTYGIHIAAPGLAIAPGTPVDQLGRARMSTVYMPGHKITMLPDEVVQAYTLIEGRDCPAVSLYVTFDEATLERKGSETKLERVPIVANLRHDQLDGVITNATLTGEAPADYAFAPELAFAFRLAQHLKLKREEVRGKPETFNRPDYSFKLIDAHGVNTMSDGIEPQGNEQVLIGTRQRGSALDLIVAEAMILANSTWGGWLADEGMMAVGALAGFAVAYGSGAGDGNLYFAVAAAAGAGVLASLLHAFAAITLRANQFVSGLALTMIGLGVAGLLGKRFEGFPLFNQAPEWPFTVGVVLLALGLAFVLAYTRLGLVLRSVGENPAAADALGIDVVRVRYLAVAFGGALAGLAGAFLSLAYRPSWTDGMTVGLGWIAVALVIFVGWSPLRAIGGAVFFGLLYYLQFRLQGQSGIPTEFFAAMPYLLVIVVLALAGLRRVQGAAPEALGQPYQRGER